MVNKIYDIWCEKAVDDPDLIPELISIKGNAEQINDAFYKELEFGTAGLRGVIGAGTNRMNIYTVGKATQGIATHLNSLKNDAKVAIGYDSRIKSDLFARVAAEIFAANGIKVYIYKELMPTPMLSFAVRELKCDAGIVITASHNPSKYNGYKAYGSDGCQLDNDAADNILKIMDKIDVFNDIKRLDFDKALADGSIEYISSNVIEKYLNCVKEKLVNKNEDLSNLSVIYSPLNGTGNKPVRKILEMVGVKDVTVVKEQELPDGNFPTAPYPNPEIREAFNCALELAKTKKADILLATDPDCDRVGIAVNIDGEYRLFTGNEVGTLLLNFILEQRKSNGTLPENPVAVKTIVTTEICKKIAADYNCELYNVLTGFKYIGGVIAELEKSNNENNFILGFEESYGYLSGTHARDKDAVVASMLICEMAAFYKSKGKNLFTVLNEIYDKYGYYYCKQQSFTCEGQTGMQKIADTMERLRTNALKEIANDPVIEINDYKTSTKKDLLTGKSTTLTLPKSNVLSYTLQSGSCVIVRPSGTEPKIKLYINAVGKNDASANEKLNSLLKAGTLLLDM